jgi:hypothetical protein
MSDSIATPLWVMDGILDPLDPLDRIKKEGIYQKKLASQEVGEIRRKGDSFQEHLKATAVD